MNSARLCIMPLWKDEKDVIFHINDYHYHINMYNKIVKYKDY